MEPLTLQDFWGLAAIPLIIALLAYIKAEWCQVSSRWYPIIGLVFSLAINVAITLVLPEPSPEKWILAVLISITASLMATGFYSQQKALRGN